MQLLGELFGAGWNTSLDGVSKNDVESIAYPDQ